MPAANNLNQITSKTAGGPLRFAGTVSKPATVTVNGVPAAVTGNSFVGSANVAAGTNTVTVSATDREGKTTSNRYQVQAGSGAGQTLTYDPNGNQLSDGAGKTYEWDAANRLTAINYTGTNQRTELYYDGMWRRIRIVEKSGGTATSDKRLLWAQGGLQPIEERDASNAVTKRFYAQGEQIGGVSYYITKDHLGSTREMTDATGSLQAWYDYSLCGSRTKIAGALESSFGFTGHYYHWKSRLHLALYRGYDCEQGRWISRDPWQAAEFFPKGPILYSYVANNPVSHVDPLGKWYIDVNFTGGYIFGLTGGAFIGPDGFHPYVGGGLTTPGLGGSIMYSPSCPSKGQDTAQVSAGLGVGGAWGVNDANDDFFQVGISTPGASAVIYHTW